MSRYPHPVAVDHLPAGAILQRTLVRRPLITEAPGPVSANMETAIQLLYGDTDEERMTEIAETLNRKIAQLRKVRPADLLREDYERPADWYKDEVVYTLYPDRFMLDETGQPSTFDSLIGKLDYLQTLGATMIYILPFLESPMDDAGFDVSNYLKVRKDLGGNEAFARLLKAARERGLKIKGDLVMNHVSEQHHWFQAAVSGDREKLDFFVNRRTLPHFKIKQRVRTGMVVSYRDHDIDKTKKSDRRLIFSDMFNTHWHPETIYNADTCQDETVYFYSTFMESQKDLNWKNPQVLYSFLDIMGYWANQGIDIFRLDALPFLIKEAGTNGENLPQTHAVVQILSGFLQSFAPRTVLQAEACQKPRDIRPYYGEDVEYVIRIPGYDPKAMTRSSEVQMAYHFPQMPANWYAILYQSSDTFWKARAETPDIPDYAVWSIFNRCHDELTLEMVPPRVRQLLYPALLPRGESFRLGYGVSGRQADFLDHNPAKIKQINALLLSLPGVPEIQYGDEIGVRNDRAFMHEKGNERRARYVGTGELRMKSFLDTRDIGRAPTLDKAHRQAILDPDTHEGQIFTATQKLIALRKQEEALTKGTLTRISTPVSQKHILTYLREFYGQRIIVIHNLSEEGTTATLRLPPQIDAARLCRNGAFDLLSGQVIAFRQDKQTIMRKRNIAQVTLAGNQSFWLKLPDANL